MILSEHVIFAAFLLCHWSQNFVSFKVKRKSRGRKGLNISRSSQNTNHAAFLISFDDVRLKSVLVEFNIIKIHFLCCVDGAVGRGRDRSWGKPLALSGRHRQLGGRSTATTCKRAKCIWGANCPGFIKRSRSTSTEQRRPTRISLVSR